MAWSLDFGAWCFEGNSKSQIPDSKRFAPGIGAWILVLDHYCHLIELILTLAI
jgi:hypothetical protein